MAKLTLLKNSKDRVGTLDQRSVNMTIRDIPLGDIDTRENVRTEYSGIDELAESVRQYGLQQPITVYRDGEEYIVKTGHRRFKAYELLYAKEPDRFNTIRCIVSDKKDIAIIQLIENVQREDLSQQDLYRALVRFREQGMSHKQIAEIMGKRLQTVDNLFTGVNEIQHDEKLLEHLTTAGGSIQDIAETKGVPSPQRLEILKKRGKGDLSRKELRQEAKILKEVENTSVSEDNTAVVPKKVEIRAVIDFNLQNATFSLVNKIEGDAFDCLKTDILCYLQQTGKYSVKKELIPKGGPQ